jgi:predicted MFS family arabinose efflux permease
MSLIAVTYGLARFAYGLFVPELRTEFGLDGAAAGAIAASSYVGYCVAIAAATLLTARWGPRPIAVTAGLAAVAGTALIAAAPTTAVLAAGVVVAGSSTGLASPPLADAVARWVTADRRNRVQTVVNAGTGLGVMVSGPIALLVNENWRVAWWVFAATAVAVTAWTAIAIPGRHDSARDGQDATNLPSPLLPPGALRLLGAAALVGLASSAVWTFGRDIAVTSGGASPQSATIMWIVLGAAGLLAAFTGDLAARVGPRTAWSAATLTLAAATACFALAAHPAILVAAAAFGAVYIALTGLLLLSGTQIYPDAPAFGVGAAFLLIAVGQAVGAPLIGILTDLTSQPTAFLIAAAAAAPAVVLKPTTTNARQASPAPS